VLAVPAARLVGETVRQLFTIGAVGFFRMFSTLLKDSLAGIIEPHAGYVEERAASAIAKRK
jgi:hypothetical protein